MASRLTMSPAHYGMIGVFAPTAALDALAAPAGATLFRVADDELAILCAPDQADTVLAAAQPAADEAGGFALDLTDGWTTMRLQGDVETAFSYLSELHLPTDGVIQGDVLRVPVRVVRTAEDTIDLLVPSPWSAYLTGEVAEALSSLDVVTVEEGVRT